MARRKLRIDMVAEVEPTLTDAAGDEGTIRGVGATLREARERRGWSIADVAQQLRIRAPVLEAMEAGNFEKLPNGAYALGFVRSYADFLGLDRDEIARRVKAEAAALSARTELIFPKPISEGRMPSGVVLIVSLALAVGGYGLWYYHSAKVQIVSPRVEAVPQRLAAQAEAPRASPRDAEAATVATSPAPSAPTAAPTTAAKADAPAAPAAAAAAPAVPSAAPPTEPAASPTVAASSSPAPVASAPSSEAAPQVAALPTNPAPNAGTSTPATETKPAASPKQYGETDGSARIILKASADSWVQVRDHAGTVVFSRILRSGDIYAVPNRPGLMLYTGSAGALNITVDGKSAPPIGRVGFTERNVTLDPERLLAGTATAEPAKPRAPAPTKPAAPSESTTPGSNG